MAKDDKAQREIRKIAYALWAQEGQPEGRDREHWEAAKEIWSFQNRDTAEAEPAPGGGEAGHTARPDRSGGADRSAGDRPR